MDDRLAKYRRLINDQMSPHSATTYSTNNENEQSNNVGSKGSIQYSMEPTFTQHETSEYYVSSVSVQGSRDHQEDRVAFDLDNHLFAIFDGHSGHVVAEYVTENLLSTIQTNLDKKIKGKKVWKSESTETHLLLSLSKRKRRKRIFGIHAFKSMKRFDLPIFMADLVRLSFSSRTELFTPSILVIVGRFSTTMKKVSYYPTITIHNQKRNKQEFKTSMV